MDKEVGTAIGEIKLTITIAETEKEPSMPYFKEDLTPIAATESK